MKLPCIQNSGRAERETVRFGGINYGASPAEGELCESLNLSSLDYPYISPRADFPVVGEYPEATALFARGKLVVVDGNRLLYDGEQVANLLPGDKRMAVVNTKLVIFPDKTYLDLENKEYRHLDAEITGEAGSVVFSDTSITVNKVLTIASEVFGYRLPRDANYFTTYTALDWSVSKGWTKTGAASRKIGDIKTGDMLIMGGGAYDSGYGWPQLNGSSERDSDGYYCVVTTVEDIEAYVDEHGIVQVRRRLHVNVRRPTANSSIGDYFKPGDAVFIEGCTAFPANNKSFILRSVSDTTLTADKGTFTAGTESVPVTIRRKVPDFDCICEHDNRLWGAEGTTVYASSLGDPTNFFVYSDAHSGVDIGSYAVAVGSDGKFTGCIGYGGSVLFFKENCLHKVLGNYPSNYEMYSYTIPGVQAGSHKSLCNMNEVLYYKGRGGVYSFTGSVPTLISSNLGERSYDNAVFGVDGERFLYMSMHDVAADHSTLFTFDTYTGILLRVDDIAALDFALLDGSLYMLSDGKVQIVNPSGIASTHIKFMAEFSPFTENTSLRKGYTKLWLRGEVSPGARFNIDISVDGDQWRTVYRTPVSSKEILRTFNVPIVPRRCDRMSIRVQGVGRVVIRALEREFYVGSDR